MNRISKLAALITGASLMTQIAAAAPGAANDARIDPQIRSFLAEINKDSSPFWELPQPKPQEILTGLQSQTAVDMSGVDHDRADDHAGWTHREAVHHDARACERDAGRAALHPRRRLDRRQFPEPSAPVARSRRRLGPDRRVRRIHVHCRRRSFRRSWKKAMPH